MTKKNKMNPFLIDTAVALKALRQRMARSMAAAKVIVTEAFIASYEDTLQR